MHFETTVAADIEEGQIIQERERIQLNAFVASELNSPMRVELTSVTTNNSTVKERA